MLFETKQLVNYIIMWESRVEIELYRVIPDQQRNTVTFGPGCTMFLRTNLSKVMKIIED